jgi:hypothetical protein
MELHSHLNPSHDWSWTPQPAPRERARYTTITEVVALADELSPRARQLVDHVGTLRLATHVQLAALLTSADGRPSDESAARSARRLLAWLSDARVLDRLDRRIGGVRAGSSGYGYYLGPVGQRLRAYWDGKGASHGRRRPEPGARFVRHRLAVSELYVEAHLLSRRGRLDLVSVDVEPDCWRTFTDRCGGRVLLKPDALVAVCVDGRREQTFVEVDLGSESRRVIARKLRTYLWYLTDGGSGAGHPDALARVSFLTMSPARQRELMDVCSTVPKAEQRLFAVSTLDAGLEAALRRRRP